MDYLYLPNYIMKRYTFLPKNWLKLILLTAFSAFISLSLKAQLAPPKQWDKTFGGSDAEVFKSLQQTSNGGYIIGGFSYSGIGGDKSQTNRGQASFTSDYWIVKLDASGNKLWEKAFGGNNQDELFIVRQTSDGGYILGGSSNSSLSGDKSQPSQGDFDYWVVKLDASGVKLWDKTFGGSNKDELQALEQTSDGGFILGGISESSLSGDKSQSSQGDSDCWIIKLDSNGTKIWDKTYGGNSDDGVNDIKEVSGGGYILGCFSGSGLSGDKSATSKGGSDYWILKLDLNGIKVWDKTIGGSDDDYLISLKQTTDGGFILGGNSYSNIGADKTQLHKGDGDYWVVKLDNNGNKTWDKTLGGNSFDELLELQQTVDGGYILGGWSMTGINGDKSEANRGLIDMWAVKLNSNGTKIWDKTIGADGPDDLISLTQTSDMGYLFGGTSSSNINNDKTSASKGVSDYWIVKLAPDIVGVKESERNSSLSIFPNPNQGNFNLHLNNLTAPKAEVTVSDLVGKVVLKQEFQTNNHQLSEEINLPNVKGIYLLQIKSGTQVITRKIVVE